MPWAHWGVLLGAVSQRPLLWLLSALNGAVTGEPAEPACTVAAAAALPGQETMQGTIKEQKAAIAELEAEREELKWVGRRSREQRRVAGLGFCCWGSGGGPAC